MRIWIAADIPSDSAGGVMRSMKELAVSLKKRGHVVKVITRQKKDRGNYLFFSLQLGIRLLLSAFNRPDWIIARSTDGLISSLVSRLFRMQTRVALHNHGWEEFSFAIERKMPRAQVNSPTTFRGLMLRFPLLRFTLRFCHLIISGTVHETESLRRKYPRRAADIVYVPNGVHVLPGVHWLETSSRPLNFLVVGNSSWKKNVRHALRMFDSIRDQLPEARLICAGTGVSDEAFAAVFGMAKPDGVVNLPSVPPAEMTQWYRECPYLLLPSRYEGGHPFAMIEAMVEGAVVFASAVPSITEVLHDGENGFLLNAVSPAEDAARIVSEIRGRIDMDRIRERAASDAANYDWRVVSANMEKLLCRS